MAALAAHLIRVGVKMINWHQIRISCRSTPSDLVVFVVTLGSCLFLKLDTAIYVGIGVSLALFLRKTSTPTLVEYAINDQGNFAELRDPNQRPHPQISIIHVEGELFFGAADLFQEQVRSLAENQNIRVFILRMKNARHLDASTVMALENLHDYLRETNRYLLISGSNPEVTHVLENSGLLNQIGRQNIFPAESNATMATRNALKRAKELLPRGIGRPAGLLRHEKGQTGRGPRIARWTWDRAGVCGRWRRRGPLRANAPLGLEHNLKDFGTGWCYAACTPYPVSTHVPFPRSAGSPARPMG